MCRRAQWELSFLHDLRAIDLQLTPGGRHLSELQEPSLRVSAVHLAEATSREERVRAQVPAIETADPGGLSPMRCLGASWWCIQWTCKVRRIMAGSKTDDGLSSNRGRRGQLKTEYHDKPNPDIVSTVAGLHGQIWSAGPSPRIGSTKALCTRGHDPSKRAATVTFYGHGGVIPTRDALRRRLTGLAPSPHVLL